MSVKQEQTETTQVIKKQKYSYPPQWSCQKGHRVDKFCTNKDCRFDAFCCRDEECFTCTTNHEDCFFGEFSQLIKRIDTRLSFENRMKMTFLSTEEHILRDLQASRREVLQKKYFWGDNLISQRINQLFFKGNKFELNGAEMNEIFTELSMKGYEEKAEECLLKFQKEINNLKRGIVVARSKYLDAILSLGKKEETKEASEQYEEDEEQLLGKQQIGMVSLSSDHKSSETVAIEINSLILQSSPEKDSMISFILKQLENPSQLKLLFRASQHNYRSQAFHKACNNIKNTFTIIQTEHDKIIAGFTPLEWTSHGFYTPDPSERSFLLQLNLRERMNLKTYKKAIYDHQHKGPSFGVGDILIEDKCNINADNSTNFPKSYQGARKYKKEHQSSWTMFSGTPIGNKFNIVEYEVFQVIK